MAISADLKQFPKTVAVMQPEHQGHVFTLTYAFFWNPEVWVNCTIPNNPSRCKGRLTQTAPKEVHEMTASQCWNPTEPFLFTRLYQEFYSLPLERNLTKWSNLSEQNGNFHKMHSQTGKGKNHLNSPIFTSIWNKIMWNTVIVGFS